jgi:hypothetical protein
VFVARSIGWVQQLFEAVRQHVAQISSAYKNMDHVVALEICPKSFAQNVGRVHVHVYLKSNGGKVWMPSLASLRFQDCLPHRTTELSTSRSRYTAGWAGFFYVKVPKKGLVLSGGSKDPFTGYPVQVNWVLTLVQAGKVSITDARKLVTRCVSGASRALAELALVEQAAEKEATDRARLKALECLARSRQTWRVVPPVNLWRAQYETVRDRYKFLVLEGPSGVGKTVFARTLVEEGKEVFELNCAGSCNFDLRQFRYQKHGLILFDEIHAGQVQGARKLFQAGVAPVQLGMSQTCMYAYEVFLHAIRLVCCSNAWTSSLAALPTDQQDWLHVNSIHVYVDRQLWED